MKELSTLWLYIALMIAIAFITVYLAWTLKDLVTWDTEVPFT